MKVSEQWLREWVNPSMTIEDVAERLTMAGLEVESISPVAGCFSGVVVGEVLSVASHPDADKLRVCQVDGHPDGIKQVVCGASNVRPGLKIPFALTGASLPAKEGDGKPLVIQSAKLRGVESSGMLCSARELGLESVQDGLLEFPADAPVGSDVREYLQLDDTVLEINVTPNRGDCLSVCGLAREVAVLSGAAITAPAIQEIPATTTDTFPVELLAGAACPRYVGRVIRDVDNSRASPLWLQEKLRRSGIRSINPVVDVTNYVMLESGQPMHAFDLGKLRQKIQVRLSRASETLKLLNEQTIALEEGTLLIADEQQPLAMAGVMGGMDSAVFAGTRSVFLESAFFEPLALAGKARLYGLHTDSSFRFERGVDSASQCPAIERATALLLEIAGGSAGPVILKEDAAHLPDAADITLRISRVEQYLGLGLSVHPIRSMLEKLGMSIREAGADYLVVQAPAWRFDIRIEVDLLEEIARIHGYNNLPTRHFPIPLDLKPAVESLLPLDAVKSRLQTLGYREVITYSFVDPALQGVLDVGADRKAWVEVQNPISAEMGVMRNSLLPGLVATTRYNLNHQQNRVRIFEGGLVYGKGQTGYQQTPVLGLLSCGQRDSINWFNKDLQQFDFYDIKGDIESLFSWGGNDTPEFVSFSNPVLHPGQSAGVTLAGKVIGWVGALHPALLGLAGLEQPVYIAQLTLDSITTVNVPVFEEVSRFPEVRRDLAFLVSRELPVQDMIQKARSVADSYLINLKVFDVYSGERIDPKRKSVALGLTFQAKSRTLTDSEIDENINRVINAMHSCFGAELRG
jgi:phenylalanyl-tRNA synthetase beta chain